MLSFLKELMFQKQTYAADIQMIRFLRTYYANSNLPIFSLRYTKTERSYSR